MKKISLGIVLLSIVSSFAFAEETTFCGKYAVLNSSGFMPALIGTKSVLTLSIQTPQAESIVYSMREGSKYCLTGELKKTKAGTTYLIPTDVVQSQK